MNKILKIKFCFFCIAFLGLNTLPSLAQENDNNIDSKKNINSEDKSIINNKVDIEKIIQLYGSDINSEISTSAVSTVKSSKLKSINTPNFGNTLVGQLNGLMVSQNGGVPGGNDVPGLMIRGMQTFAGGNGIIVLVDGFETKWDDIIPDEVESVSVLKDAAALALYGIKGANGIVYIKTRRGINRKKNQITFNARYSIQQAMTKPNFVGNGTYAELYNQALLNDGKPVTSGPFGNPKTIEYLKDGSQPLLFSDVNWYDQALKKQGISQDYNITINGGNDKAVYNVILGFMNTTGLFNSDPKAFSSNWDMSRFNLRSNLDVKLNNVFSLETGLRATINDKKQPNVNLNWFMYDLGNFIPFPIKTDQGKWAGSQSFPANPVAELFGNGYVSNLERNVDANVKLIADLSTITKGLKAYAQASFSNYWFSGYNKTRGYAYTELAPVFDPISNELINTTSQVRGTDSDFSISQPSGIQTNRTNYLAGISYDTNLSSTDKLHISSNYNEELYRTTGYARPFGFRNIMGRVNYQHAEKYIAEFAYSVSGTDNYAKGKRMGFFPTGSAAWIITKEDFMKDVAFVDLIKARVSYGLLGNSNPGYAGRFIFNQYVTGQGSYNFGSLLDQGVGGSSLGPIANFNSTWEKAQKFNIGIDAKLFKGLSLNIDYFNENRNDIYVNPSSYLSGLIGANYYMINAGKVQNSGIEIAAKYEKNIGDFYFFVAGKYMNVKDKIVDMKEAPQPEEYLYRKGRSIGQIYGLESIGFFKDMNDIATSIPQFFGAVKPGDIKYKDQNGDNLIDEKDVIPTSGSYYPTSIYSFDLGFSFKGFDFALFLQGTQGSTVSIANYSNPFITGNKPQDYFANNYWTPELGDNAEFPKLTTELNSNNLRTSTLWLRNADYLRIKNIEIGYTLPIKRLTDSKIRVYLNAVNPLTLSKLSKFNVDPEVNDPLAYPMMKSYNIGLNFQF